MTERARLAPLALAGAGDPRAYLQARLALYAQAITAGSAVLVAFVIALYDAYPAQRPPHDEIILAAALAGQLAFAAIWFALRARPWSLAALGRVDAGFALIAGLELGGAAFLQSERYAAIYSALSFAVFARTIVVPSSGTRTFAVSAAAFAPMLAGAVAAELDHAERLDMQPLPFLAGVVLFAGVTVTLATLGSRVIYGLRRQVREAMQLGAYTLEEKIAEGGMGAIYRARHAMLRRPTAIKLLPPERFGPDALRRFEREVQNMSRLTHPNTVAVFDYGRSPDGVFYYAMEFLDGVDLESLIARDGPQPAPRVVHVLRQVCGALEEAHATGLIHRDIKPANLMLCQRGGKPDVVKVFDFGLVKEITRTTDESGMTTEIAGTPAYLSPEAVTTPALVGPRSDLYALGAVAYFLLTGHRVFDGKTAVAVCAQHVATAPRPPSERTANAIPADLEALVLACLAKDPAARPASAQALRAALGALPSARAWDEDDATAWWRAFEARRREPPPPPPPGPTISITRDLARARDQTAEAGAAELT